MAIEVRWRLFYPKDGSFHLNGCRAWTNVSMIHPFISILLSRAVTEFRPVSGEPKDRSARWQTANLVHAFAPFVWMHISNEHKEVLEEYGINNFLDVHYVKWGKSGPARDVARHVYDKIDSDLRYLAERMMIAKEDASKRRNPLARPHISDTEVREFLKELEDGTPGLTSLLEIARFAHIKLTANIDAPGHGNRIPWGTPE